MDAATYKTNVLVRIRKAHLTDLTNGIAEMTRGAEFPSTIDLALIYSIDPGMDAGQIASRIRDVRTWWNASMQRSNVKEVAKFCSNLDALLVEKHRDLASTEFWRRWESQRNEQSHAALEGLGAMLDHQYRDFGVITLAQVRAAATTNSLLSQLPDDALTSVIDSSPHLTLVDEFAAPTFQIPGPVRREWNTTTNLRTFMDAIFFENPPSDFRLLDGFVCTDRQPPTAATLRASLDACDKRAGTDIEAAKKLLHALREAQGNGFGLAELTLVQLIEVAREFLQGGIVVLAIQKLVEKGLDRTDAARVVMHCAGATSPGQRRDTPERVLELLAEGKLRAARTLYTALSNIKAHADTEALAEALRSLTRNEDKVTQLRTQAESALGSGQVAVATELLSQAFALAEDDEPLARLVASLPPAPPIRLDLTVDDSPVGRAHAIRILWSASPGADTETTYVIVRKTGSAPRDIRDGSQISSTTSTEVLDPNPPVAERLWYAVAARRGGEPSPVTTADIVLLPPVADVTVTTDQTSVEMRWTPPRAAARISVVQIDPAGRRLPVPVRASNSFVAEGLRTSETYTFELTAEYHDSSGPVLKSSPVRVSAVPRRKARPLDRLDIHPDRFNGTQTEVTAEWAALLGEDVEVWQFPNKPNWAFGTSVEYSTLSVSGGARLQGNPERTGTRMRLTGSVPAGLRHYVAITPDQTTAMIGASTSLAICEPVSAPSVERFGDQAVVSWDWPRADYRVRAMWSAGDREGVAQISQPEYVRNGGLRITVGPHEAKIRIASVLESAEQQWTSPEVVLTLSGAQLCARYRLLWPKKFVGRGPLLVEFAADTEVRGVAAVVHVQHGPYLLQRPAAGTAAQRIPLDIQPSGPQVVELRLPKLPKPYWVRCFAETPETLNLADPPSDTLRGR